MSSSRSKRSRHHSRGEPSSSSGSYFPTQWSTWEWNTDLGRFQRYRLRAPGEYEFEDDPPQTQQPQEVPRTITPPALDAVPELNGAYSTADNYTTSPGTVQGPTPLYSSPIYSQLPLASITQGLARVDLGGVSNSQFGYTQARRGNSSSNHITTRDPRTSREEFDHHYKVHSAFEFKWGRVFKVLWAEPSGNGGGGQSSNDGSSDNGTVSERSGKYGQPSFQKVRRFVIIKPMDGHCICLPINTYSRQGVCKKGVKADHHTAVFSGKKPVYFKGERSKGLTKTPIKIVPSSIRHKLADESRLNYAKNYTVEYNVKVWFIGKVDKDSEWYLSTDYNNMHPLLDVVGSPPPFAQDYEEEGAPFQSLPTHQPLGLGSSGWNAHEQYTAMSTLHETDERTEILPGGQIDSAAEFSPEIHRSSHGYDPVEQPQDGDVAENYNYPDQVGEAESRHDGNEAGEYDHDAAGEDGSEDEGDEHSEEEA